MSLAPAQNALEQILKNGMNTDPAPSVLGQWTKERRQYCGIKIGQVNKRTYKNLQDLVPKFISEKDPEIKLPVQFDDKYWYLLKEGLLAGK